MPVLTLGRKVNERVMIGSDIIVKIVEIDRNKVRLSIEAPESVEVDREEVRAKKLAGLLQPPLAMDDHDTRVLNNWLGELEYGEAGA